MILLVEGATARAIMKIDDVLVGRKVLNVQQNAIKVWLAATSLYHLATCSRDEAKAIFLDFTCKEVNNTIADDGVKEASILQM